MEAGCLTMKRRTLAAQAVRCQRGGAGHLVAPAGHPETQAVPVKMWRRGRSVVAVVVAAGQALLRMAAQAAMVAFLVVVVVVAAPLETAMLVEMVALDALVAPSLKHGDT